MGAYLRSTIIATSLAGALACAHVLAQSEDGGSIPRESLEALSRAVGHIKYDFVEARDDAVLVNGCAAGASAAARTSNPPKPGAGDLTAIPHVIMNLKASAPTGVTYRGLVYGCIRGMVKELDAQSQFYEPEEYRLFLEPTDSQSPASIGLELKGGGKDPALVAYAVEDGPAWRGGIRIGDRLLAVDGASVDGKDVFTIVGSTRGKSGSQVTLTVQRNAAAAARKVNLTRETMRFTPVKLAWQDGNVLVVRVPQFRSGTRDSVVREIEKFSETSKREPEGLVLDLRDNPRGTFVEAFYLAALFLPLDTVLGTTRGRGRNASYTYKAIERDNAPLLTSPMSGAFKNAPMAVLVNGNTAAAAEGLAAALQANGRAFLAGYPTGGAGALPAYFGLGDRSVVKVTRVYMYTPKNEPLDHKPLVPDVRMPDRLAPGAQTELGPADEALHETVRVLLAKKAKP